MCLPAGTHTVITHLLIINWPKFTASEAKDNMSQLCGCMGSNDSEPRTQVAAHPEAGFRPRTSVENQPPQYDAVSNGYTPVVPLPRYTPRPMSIHEKTIENGSHDHHRQQPDEKNRHDFEEESALQSQSTGSSSTATATATMDDASSAYSFPSSFGHTSTETRDTPPPPYSSCGSSSLFSRSRASSLRSHHRRSLSLYNYPVLNQAQAPPQPNAPEFVPATIAPPPMAHINSTHALPTPYTTFTPRQLGSRPTPHPR